MEHRYTEAGYQWDFVTYEKFVFEDVDKMRIVSEYYEGHEPASSVVKRYKLSSKQVLFSWMDKSKLYDRQRAVFGDGLYARAGRVYRNPAQARPHGPPAQAETL